MPFYSNQHDEQVNSCQLVVTQCKGLRNLKDGYNLYIMRELKLIT
jgi:hypothetical protein